MQRQELQALVEALEEPAFFAQDNCVALGNAAFHAMKIEDGTPLAHFFRPDSGELTAEPGAKLPCTVCGAPYDVRTVPQGEGVLYLLSRRSARISARILAHTAKTLRGPLQQMYSALDMLDLSLPEADAQAEESMSSLLQGVFRLERTAENLEYMEKLHGGEYTLHCTRQDLTEFLRALCEKAEALLQSTGIRLRWQLPEGAFPGNVDTGLLSLAFWNLLSNAARYAASGTIWLAADRYRLNTLRLRVTDSGDGIAPEHQLDLMQHYQLPPEETEAGAGIGLGLSLVRSVASLHGGCVAISMAQGGATTVVMTLDTNRPATAGFHSPVQRLQRSLDDGLVGLSEVLPRSAFDRRDILS